MFPFCALICCLLWFSFGSISSPLCCFWFGTNQYPFFTLSFLSIFVSLIPIFDREIVEIAVLELTFFPWHSRGPPFISELMVRITSKNRPGYFWAVDEGIEGYLMRESELFRVVSPGLNGKAGSISFESVLRPGYYIVNKNGLIDVDSLPNTGFSEESFRFVYIW